MLGRPSRPIGRGLLEVRERRKGLSASRRSFAKGVGVYGWKGNQLGGDEEDLARPAKKEVQSAGKLQVGCDFDYVDAEF